MQSHVCGNTACGRGTCRKLGQESSLTCRKVAVDKHILDEIGIEKVDYRNNEVVLAMFLRRTLVGLNAFRSESLAESCRAKTSWKHPYDEFQRCITTTGVLWQQQQTREQKTAPRQAAELPLDTGRARLVVLGTGWAAARLIRDINANLFDFTVSAHSCHRLLKIRRSKVTFPKDRRIIGHRLHDCCCVQNIFPARTCRTDTKWPMLNALSICFHTQTARLLRSHLTAFR